ncbi:VOC family protein [Salipaludibacillus sp. HK11]|uniref:VOC family protein n=1 Tax=Salipaludibacillus sp. HK11 TaxID=3394320 RepID=UPI0039FC721C
MTFHQSPATYINEVLLKVKNLHQSIEFYEKTLGLHLLLQTERTAVLSANGDTPLISLEQPVDVVEKQPTRTTGLYHFALLLPSRVELAKLLTHLIESNYPIQGASDHLVSEAIYLADPDGNGIEIYIDRPSNEWEWQDGQVKMAVDPMDAEALLAEAVGHEWANISPGTVMGHIHMHVSDLGKAESFYCDGLGFNVVCQFGNQALFISSQDYHHHIGLNTWAGVGAPPPDEKSVGISWYQIVYPDSKSRKQVLANLSQQGFSVEEVSNEFYTVDPAGNKIKLSVSEE